MADVILDTSAVLASFNAEPGAEVVEEVMSSAAILSVTVAEILTKFVEFGIPEGACEAMYRGLGLAVVPFDEALAIRSGLLRGVTKEQGLSLGDRACLALAERENVPVLTADQSWAELDIGVEVRLIR